MSAIDDSIREFNALAKQQDAALSAAAAPVQGGPHNASMSWAIGTRVLDLVSGESGTVIDGKRENVIIPSA
jgi:hypothetical protein